MPLVLNPPPTAVEPVTEVLHGVPIADPYRWLEDQNSPRTREWINAQVCYARTYLDDIPGRDRMRTRIENLLAVETYDSPCYVHDRYFFLKREATREQPCICMRDSLEGKDEILVDPVALGTGPTSSVQIISVSSCGSLIAYSVREGGEDSYAVRIFDINRGTTLEDGLSKGFLGGFAFAPDGKSYFYSFKALNAERPHYRAVFRHWLGSQSSDDREVFFAGEDRWLGLSVQISADGRYLGYLVTRNMRPVEHDFYVQDLQRESRPKRVCEGIESPFQPSFIGDRLYAHVRVGATNGRIVLIEIAHPARDRWKEVVPESGAAIHQFISVGKRLIVSYVENLGTVTRVFDLSGTQISCIKYPALGSARLFAPVADGDQAFCSFTSFSHPVTILRYDTRTDRQQVWAQTKVPFDEASIESRQVSFSSKDGTEIPMTVLCRKSEEEVSSRWVVMMGYGGFGNSFTPQFTVFATFLIERGCLIAYVNLRGGAEYGRKWHEAGKGQNRQNAFDDFIAAAEWLIRHQFTVAAKLAIVGGSNGGLLVGAALTQRPDLFRAVICLGPLLDMLRFHQYDHARFLIDEYGSPEDPRDFEALVAYSPYQQVKDGVSYPAVLLVSGDADSRCNPMHARKMAARLQSASSSRYPILLDYKTYRGHAPVMPLSERIEALVDRVAFLCDQLSINAREDNNAVPRV